jgi:hypothetical protein
VPHSMHAHTVWSAHRLRNALVVEGGFGDGAKRLHRLGLRMHVGHKQNLSSWGQGERERSRIGDRRAALDACTRSMERSPIAKRCRG